MTNYYEGLREDQKKYYNKKYNKILEIGGGNGGNRKNFERNIEYWLVEPNIESANKAKEIIENVLIGTYEEVKDNIPDEYFDLIICNDVIEHIPKWNEFLIEIKNKMNGNEAELVGSIPNVRHFYALYNLIIKKNWPYQKEGGGIFDITHVAFFTFKSLRKELIEAGYKINNYNLEKKFKFTKDQNIIKYIMTKILIIILGKDTGYSHLYFKVKK